MSALSLRPTPWQLGPLRCCALGRAAHVDVYAGWPEMGLETFGAEHPLHKTFADGGLVAPQHELQSDGAAKLSVARHSVQLLGVIAERSQHGLVALSRLTTIWGEPVWQGQPHKLRRGLVKRARERGRDGSSATMVQRPVSTKFVTRNQKRNPRRMILTIQK
jgi:hypothetical protein